MKDARPVFLNLLKIKFPLPAIVSVFHRISGVIIFLLFPLLLWAFDRSFSSPEGFASLQQLLHQPIFKFFIWVVLSALLYHVVAGIRHIMVDMGIGESLTAARVSAYGVMIVSGILIVLTGIWLW